MLNDRKITDWTQPVSSLDDRPQMTAAALKAAFDSNTNQIKPAVNGMIDDLTGTGGAGNIGVDVIAGVTGTTVQAMLAALKALIDLCDTSAESDDKLNLKADKTTTDKLVKTITFDAGTGVFTIKTDDGTTTTIDTMLEKIPINCYLDGQEFVLVLDDGTEQRADLSDFITETEFTDSSTIDFSVTGSNVTATVKNGSITLSMLENTVMSTLQSYMTAAQESASNAATSETNAGTYRDQAQGSATAAASSASEASAKSTLSESWAVGGTGTRQGEDTNNSKYFAQQSANSAATAQGWSDSAMEQADAAAQSAADAAQSAADAEAISGGDFIPNSRKGVPNGVATLDSNGKLVMAQLPDDTEAIPVTLTAAGWTVSEPYTQTVNANGVLADEDAQMIIPVPEDDSSEAYYSAGVRCTAQAANSLTFTCDAKPDDDIALYAIVSSVGNTAGGGGTSSPVLPTPTTGDAGKVPTVNDTEDGYELKTPSGGGGTGGTVSVEVASTTTGEPGTDASVTNSGTNTEVKLNFTIPRGATGATGATPNLQIGEVTTLDAGSDATASITGTAKNPLLNLGIPKGADGGGGSEKAWTLLGSVTLDENVVSVTMPVTNCREYLVLLDVINDDAGNAGNRAAMIVLNANGLTGRVITSGGVLAASGKRAAVIHVNKVGDNFGVGYSFSNSNGNGIFTGGLVNASSANVSSCVWPDEVTSIKITNLNESGDYYFGVGSKFEIYGR